MSYAYDIADRVDAIYDQMGANVFVTKMFVFADADPASFGTPSSLDEYLARVTTWAQSGAILEPHDVVLLLTGLDLSAGMTGLAQQGTACSPYAVAVIKAGLSADFVAASVAHELGHILGATHDGVGNTCPASGFVMAPLTSAAATLFSSCSKASLLQTFQTASCLKNYPYALPDCDDGSCPLEPCAGGDAVSCPASSCFKTPGMCDPGTGQCGAESDRTPSLALLQTERDAQCKAAWAGYTGNWVAGDRSGGGGTCGTGCGDLRCTNTEWSNYCYTYTCPAGYTCTVNGERLTGPATRDVCSCLDTPQGAAGDRRQVAECTPCLRGDGAAGFCNHGECLAMAPEDVPSAASKLKLTNSTSSAALSRSVSRGEKLLFSAYPAVDFPPPGGATDPRLAESAIELFSASGEGAVLPLPAGGWMLSPKGTAYKFVNKNAPDDFSAVRTATIKTTSKGTLLKVKAKSSGLPLGEANQRVGIRFTVGPLRICALFNEATIKTDGPDEFSASNALAGDLKDCSPSSLRAQP